jgi:hypothetical protein
LLANILCSDDPIAPRDLDIIRLTHKEPDSDQDHSIAMTYMYDDYRYGHGVEIVHDIVDYFSAHDFTINELYATPDEIVATPRCVYDMLKGNIRLTEYETRDYPNEKLLAKAIRFMAESEHSSLGAFLPDEALDSLLRTHDIAPFFIALHLDKAWEQSRNFAADFVDRLKEYHQLPDSVITPEDAVEHLNQFVYDFAYRSLADQYNAPDPMESLTAHLDLEEEVCKKYEDKDNAERKSYRMKKDFPVHEKSKRPDVKWADHVKEKTDKQERYL